MENEIIDLTEIKNIKEVGKELALEIYFIKHNFYCEECNKWINEDDLNEKYCPYCGIDILF